MMSGNSPFISKTARYNFLSRYELLPSRFSLISNVLSMSRSVRMGSKHNVRASILASSLSEVTIRIIKIIIINSSLRLTSSFTPVELLTPLGRLAWCSTHPGEPHLWHASDGQELYLATLSPWCNMPRLTMANMPISPMWAQTCPGFIN